MHFPPFNMKWILTIERLKLCIVVPFVDKGGGTYFHLGGKDKKGHCNVKKGTNGVHADNYH